jgi:magnesium transporter
MKALEKSREIPREFALYLPLSIRIAAHQLPGSLIGTDMNTRKEMGNHHILWTTSLPLVLAQLDIASRKFGKHRRLRHHQNETLTEQTTSVAASHTLTQTILGIPSPSTSQVRSPSPGPARKAKKGKEREAPVGNEKPIPISIQEDLPLRPAAWFLDVANPTWADLRAIGKVRPLIIGKYVAGS